MMEVVLIIIFLFCFTGAYAGIKGAPWVPTNKNAVERFLSLADVKKGDRVCDLGCGDGRIIFASAKKGAVVEGFEISLFPFLLASFLKIFQKEKKNIKIHYHDMMKADISRADVVYCFLMPAAYSQVAEKLKREMKKGTKVVTFVWPIKGWTVLRVDKAERKPNLYLYEI